MSATSREELETLQKAAPTKGDPTMPPGVGVAPQKSTLGGATAPAVGQGNALRFMRISPDRIAPSRFPNRLEETWTTTAYEELKADIESVGGNIQPIKVRPVEGRGTIEFEVVYGHRRHQACLDLGIPVLALIEAVDDRRSVSDMVRENNHRKDRSPYERGLNLKMTRDDGLFTSDRQLAEAPGLNHTLVSKLIKLAELPGAVIHAFECSSKIHVNWGAPLTKVLMEDRDGVMDRAIAIRAAEKPRAAKWVFEQLTAPPAPPPRAQYIELEREGERWATIRVPFESRGGGASVAFVRDAVDIAELEKVLRAMLAKV